MKKIILAVVTLVMAITIFGYTVLADSGDMGFFGGITEGVRLPKTSEEILEGNSKKTAEADIETIYKEILFIAGVPVEFTGLMTVKKSGSISDKTDNGSYKVTYTVRPSAATSPDAQLTRTIAYDVNWYRDKALGQIIKDYRVSNWTETIVAGGITYTLDDELSRYDVSIIEDIMPGVKYYTGRQSASAVYFAGEDMTAIDFDGVFYGYDSVWSKAEVHRVAQRVNNSAWQLSCEVRPSVSVNKTLRYQTNEPQAISFSGNYLEVFQNESGLVYDIYTLPQRFYGTPEHGTASISTDNVFENLIAVNTSRFASHWAHEDIARLYAMKILDQNITMFEPDQLITRSQFFVMLVKAIKLPLEEPPVSKSKNKVVDVFAFSDVGKERPDYKYIMAAYKAGIAVGKGGSDFCPDDYVTMEEAIYTMIRALGLLNLGLEPTNMTPFADDGDISPWAKKALYAAYRIRLISQYPDGTIAPQQNLTKAAGAAVISRMIEYMRAELKEDYTVHIVYFAN